MPVNQKQQHTGHQNQATAKTRKTEPKAVRNIDPVQMTSAPETLRSEDVLAAQQQVGNQVVQRALDKKGRDRSVTDGQGNLNEDLASQIQAKRGGGSPLPDSIQQETSKKLGRKFNDVRLHTDETADKLSRSVSARAFTIGKDIFFKGGVFSPTSSAGRETLIHELTHVVQQSGSKTSEAGKLKLGAPDTAMEKQAAHMGKKHATQPGAATLTAGAVQRQEEEEEMQMQPDANSLIQRQEEEEEMQMQPDVNNVIQRAGNGLTEEDKEDLNPKKGAISPGIASRVAMFGGSNSGKKDPDVGSTQPVSSETEEVGSSPPPTPAKTDDIGSTTQAPSPEPDGAGPTTQAPSTDVDDGGQTPQAPSPEPDGGGPTTQAPSTDVDDGGQTPETPSPEPDGGDTTTDTTSQVSDPDVPAAPDISALNPPAPKRPLPKRALPHPPTELEKKRKTMGIGSEKNLSNLAKKDKGLDKNIGAQVTAEKEDQKAGGRRQLMNIIQNPKSSAEDVAAAQEKLDMLHKRSKMDQIKSFFTKGESSKSYANQAKAQRKKGLKSAALKGDDEAFKKYKSEKKPSIKSKIGGLFKKGAGFLASKLGGVVKDQAKGKLAESQKQFPQFFGSGDKKKEESKPAAAGGGGGGGSGGGGGGLAETISQLYQENKQLKNELAGLKKKKEEAPAP